MPYTGLFICTQQTHRRECFELFEGLDGGRGASLTVCTLTVVAALDGECVDLQRLLDRFDEPQVLGARRVPELPGFPARRRALLMDLDQQALQQEPAEGGKRRRPRLKFHNQLTLAFADESSKKSVKVFRNGKLHVTGCKSLAEFDSLGRRVCEVLEAAVGIAYALQQPRVHMMNCTFSLGVRLNLQELADALRADGLLPEYDADNYQVGSPAHSLRVARLLTRLTPVCLHPRASKSVPPGHACCCSTAAA